MSGPGATSVDPPGSLRARQKQLTRDRLLDAAVTVFADKSFVDATMDDIARAAGVARVTVYAHFPGKNDIIQALATQVYEAMGEVFAALGALPGWSAAGIRSWLEETARAWQPIARTLRVIHVEGAVALSKTDRAAAAARDRYVEEHERYAAMLTAVRGRWRGRTAAESRQRALMAVLQTESFLTAWLAAGVAMPADDPLDLLTSSVCHLLGVAAENTTWEV
ncbi:TetR/AcrR family transcriptional regulator [Actinoplanes sp. RD1]|uniref:TetR/AcrR family transcriptional regulator n=1 Tax=Actinoplanes sp. RD1 TaxID=3064538 RepID=UPI0027414790|nr:TetR/AcrR family transcriptional regulator [Actinoplanes sp. RD1]